ncbi:right-handed parallel beta-helix repeat-containing protein [Demequina aurantiaca]|uniref:right-handed parallel beta-helix repeat-containing protein n=1 Tax=Demequina aurantiaca TaxID=676200 RepID=UPI003D3337AB
MNRREWMIAACAAAVGALVVAAPVALISTAQHASASGAGSSLAGAPSPGEASSSPTAVEPTAPSTLECCGSGTLDAEGVGAAAAEGSQDVQNDAKPSTKESEGTAASAAAVVSAAPPAAQVPRCPAATVNVGTADALAEALEAAQPGDVIGMADGVYEGNFVAEASGTSSEPIVLCGSQDAILDSGGPKEGYVLHLDGASHWTLLGFTVRNGQKGVMADGSQGSVIAGLTVHQIGDEAIHLRGHSSDNAVIGNTIFDTGLRRDKYGEGVYVGTAQSNWCDITDCKPDNSDRNLIQDNTIYDVTAEAIDVKEGTSNGAIRGNSFDGSAVTSDGGDSWVDVKGNQWLIEGNVGESSPNDGFQTHEILEGWGAGNVFRDNVADVGGPGYGISLTPSLDNVVACSNIVTNAAEGYSNVACI